MAGLLLVSISSGQIISRTGRYRFFPIAGSAVMTVGMFLLHLMGVHTSTVLDALFMLVLGMGIGGVMQVLVIIVQNGVPHGELGVATSGATFFRSIGASAPARRGAPGHRGWLRPVDSDRIPGGGADRRGRPAGAGGGVARRGQAGHRPLTAGRRSRLTGSRTGWAGRQRPSPSGYHLNSTKPC
jgi:hypothetical protein